MKSLIRALGLVVLLMAPSADAKSEVSTTGKATHILNRATFGPKPGQIEELAKSGDVGIQKWIETQLRPQSIPDAAVEQKLQALPTLTMSNEELYSNYPRPNKKSGEMPDRDRSPRQILNELSTQKLIRATESKREFQEVLVDFWYNHFNVDYSKGRGKWLVLPFERDAIRPHLFGNFFDLLKATAQSPAMLFYLDNFQSVKNGYQPKTKNTKKAQKSPKGINENYARELMELHTLGVDGGYTQKDVVEVARILTGWGLGRSDGGSMYEFRMASHDTGSKKVMGQTFPAGGGEEEGVRLLRFLADHPSTAHHIAEKLAVRFISDNPPASAIDALAKTFTATHGNLSAVYRKLFELPEFWSADAQHAKIKKPFHFIASSIRALNGTIDGENSRGLRKIDQALLQMGEPVYRCQPPTGFKQTSEFWVNPGALVTRINTSLDIAHHRLPGIAFNMDFFKNRLDSMKIHEDRAALEYFNQWLLGGALQSGTVDRISQELANAGPKVVEEKEAKSSQIPQKSINVAQMMGLLLGSPEFQRY